MCSAFGIQGTKGLRTKQIDELDGTRTGRFMVVVVLVLVGIGVIYKIYRYWFDLDVERKIKASHNVGIACTMLMNINCTIVN